MHFGVLWLTGLSGSGKTTLAYALHKKLTDLQIPVHVLDGDELREGLNSDLGFSPADRKENIRRAAELCCLLLSLGYNVIAAFISPYQRDRELAREKVGRDKFIEVSLQCPLQVCMQRDPKKLYRKAKADGIGNFTGLGAPYEIPTNPQIKLQTDAMSVEKCLTTILAYLWERR